LRSGAGTETYRPWLTTFAPILISFSVKVTNDKSFIGFGVDSVSQSAPRLKACAL
jgi:hypothetical protein